MDLEEKNKLLEFRRCLIVLVGDLQRVIAKQEDLLRTGQFTLENSKRNTKRFKEDIQLNLDLILIVEKQLEKEYDTILK